MLLSLITTPWCFLMANRNTQGFGILEPQKNSINNTTSLLISLPKNLKCVSKCFASFYSSARIFSIDIFHFPFSRFDFVNMETSKSWRRSFQFQNIILMHFVYNVGSGVVWMDSCGRIRGLFKILIRILYK